MVEKMQKSKSILGLLVTQFFGAFNDNAWKIILFTLATRLISDAVGETQLAATQALLVFLLPMCLFSLPAIAFADRISKRKLILAVKAAEIALMGAAAISLWWAPHHLFVPYILLGLMGAQSALFTPGKYGILPELLPKHQLPHGNALLEMWTMLAIIGGTGFGPALLAPDGAGARPWLTWIAPAILAVLASISFGFALRIPRVEPASREQHSLITSLKRAWGAIRSDKMLWTAFWGMAVYWMVISLLGQNVLVYAKSIVAELERGEIWQGLPPAAFGVGIALGALLGGRLSGGQIELGLIPFGAMCFSATALTLGIVEPAMVGTLIILIPMGMACGMLVVPLNAIIQWRAPADQRGSIISLSNFFDIGCMIIGSLIAVGMAMLGWKMRTMLVMSALLVVGGTVAAVRILPEALLRIVMILLTRIFYKLRVKGARFIPNEGPALLAANHMSLVDGLLILASIKRPVRFIMSSLYYNKWWMRPLAKAMQAIPVSATDNPKSLIRAFQEAGEALDRGEVVCIFPEGQITRTGNMQPFHRGIERIARGRDVPIIPVHLDRVWESMFSFKGGRPLKYMPQGLPLPIVVSIGEPLPVGSSVAQLRQAVKELECDAWVERKEDLKPIHHAFIRQVRRKPWALALADERTPKMSRGKLLSSAIALARALRKDWDGQSHVGILLPSSIASVIANVAATLSSRSTVNLNFTAGVDGMASAIRQADIQTVLTSRAFLEKGNVTIPNGPKVLYIEDIIERIDDKAKLWALTLAIFAPIPSIERACGTEVRPDMDSLATVIFTSGSTGDPKGVMLSHFNIASNVQGVAQVMPRRKRHDKILGILPHFHSFGTMTMWLGLNQGLPLIMHANPLEGTTIGKLIEEYGITIMLTTPTFLNIYLHRVAPGQFGSLRMVLTGAERLSPKLAARFKERFGIRPIEGYGATECSPVIATSTLDFRSRGSYQIGAVPGSVGQSLPGIVTRIVDPESYQTLEPGKEGMLIVRGPNIMKGYLGQPELSAKAMYNGWYITGDIATRDENGFIRITDRLSRFSKIGGEMVPHGRIEEALHEAAAIEAQSFVVSAVPNEKKGESLAVLTTLDKRVIKEILDSLNLPPLFMPRLDHFIQVPELPILGTGKIDLRRTKSILMEQLA